MVAAFMIAKGLGLLIVDMQNFYLAHKEIYLGLEAAYRQIVKPIRRLIDQAHIVGAPVIYLAVTVTRPQTGSRFSRWATRGIKAPQSDYEIVDELKPGPQDFVVNKCRFNGFLNSELPLLVRNLGIDTLIVAGIVTEVCVESTVRGAIDNDIRVLLPEDCTGSSSEDKKQVSLRNLTNFGHGIEITSSEKILSTILTTPVAR
jgi:nicotinamidase-related amidase